MHGVLVAAGAAGEPHWSPRVRRGCARLRCIYGSARLGLADKSTAEGDRRTA
jgi:hypothetical protein